MALGPVVSGTTLPKNEVVWPKNLAKGSRPHGVHCAGLQVHQDGTRNVFAAGRFVVVDIDAFQLELTVAMVGAGGVNAVLVGDDFPELKQA